MPRQSCTSFQRGSMCRARRAACRSRTCWIRRDHAHAVDHEVADQHDREEAVQMPAALHAAEHRPPASWPQALSEYSSGRPVSVRPKKLMITNAWLMRSTRLKRWIAWRVGRVLRMRAVLDALDERADQPEQRVQPEEPEREAHHDHEVQPHAVQQRIALAVAVVGVRLELGELGGGLRVALAAGLHAVVARAAASRGSAIRRMSCAPWQSLQRGRAGEAQRRRPARDSCGGRSRTARSCALPCRRRLVVALPALVDDVEHERRACPSA